jgi:hypothetical protein
LIFCDKHLSVANLHLFSICPFVYGLDSRVFHTMASQEKRKEARPIL